MAPSESTYTPLASAIPPRLPSRGVPSFSSSIQLSLSRTFLRSQSRPFAFEASQKSLWLKSDVEEQPEEDSNMTVNLEDNGAESDKVVLGKVDALGVNVEEDKEQRGKSYTGLLLIAAAAFIFSIMSASIKCLAASEPTNRPATFQVMFVRCFASLIYSTIGVLLLRPPGLFMPPQVRGLLCLRGVTSSLSTGCYYYALGTLKLSDAVVLSHTTPIWTGVLAVYFLGEKWGPREAGVTLLCLLGVLLIAKPSFVVNLVPGLLAPPPQHPIDNPLIQDGDPDNDTTATSLPPAPAVPMYSAPLIPVLIALGSALFGSFSGICIRKIGTRAHPIQMVFGFSVFTTLSALLSIAALPDQRWTLSTMGLQREKAARASNISYTQIVYSFMWGWVLWGELPDMLCVIGSVIVVSGVLFMAAIKTKK
ncbi:hypothetical protein M427DRAFT_34118 [Gonapodya prolifera JEL478]|uniref:EamA domain-containing protein n=1 Tax=Gonapodya prolifera (strain JEL478) TaxID=1344416 RepID=A0A139A8W5_GONPJ|nr:hypothetical protein M427DRAFT_34118 [Gonapodya prolifera JEL478]|eukprot:KXS13252.1 hypothetical protein M427DRAFT_34118 [Gonapodya prolifera JEL478]